MEAGRNLVKKCTKNGRCRKKGGRRKNSTTLNGRERTRKVHRGSMKLKKGGDIKGITITRRDGGNKFLVSEKGEGRNSHGAYKGKNYIEK